MMPNATCPEFQAKHTIPEAVWLKMVGREIRCQKCQAGFTPRPVEVEAFEPEESEVVDAPSPKRTVPRDRFAIPDRSGLLRQVERMRRVLRSLPLLVGGVFVTGLILHFVGDEGVSQLGRMLIAASVPVAILLPFYLGFVRRRCELLEITIHQEKLLTAIANATERMATE